MSTPRRGLKAGAIAPVRRPNLFGPPLLLPGEDAAALEKLLARANADLKPVDIIDEMYLNGIVTLQFDVMRLHRLKVELIKAQAIGILTGLLRPILNYSQYRQDVQRKVTLTLEKLRGKWPGRVLAKRYFATEEVDDKVDELLAQEGLNIDVIGDLARDKKAEKLARGCVQGNPRAVKLLKQSGRTLEDVLAQAFAEKLDQVERIERLAGHAEIRRDACWKEIERRRPPLGVALRRHLQKVEDAEFREIENKSANAA